MIKRLVRFVIVFLTAAILFTACPIEYVPPETLPLPPSNWLTVNVPKGFSGELTGEAGGYLWWRQPPGLRDIRPPLPDQLIKVTFSFYNGQMTNFVIYYENESYYYDFVEHAIAAWERRVRNHGISGITEPLSMDESSLHLLPPPPNPFHGQWPIGYIDAFAGATMTVHALSIAARNALCVLMPDCGAPGCECITCICNDNDNGNGCETPGCECGEACPGDTCNCNDNNNGGGNGNGCETHDCTCGEACTGSACRCLPFNGSVTGQGMGYFHYVFVTFHFVEGVLTSVAVNYNWDSSALVAERTEFWASYVLTNGRVPPHFVLYNVPTVPPFDVFAGATVTINGLREAARDAGFIP